MKKDILFFFGALMIVPLFAQHSLQSRYNMFRADDQIIKQQVKYKEPGRTGENVLWDFSKLTALDDEYSLNYSSWENSIVGTEHNTMYYYSLSNDSLLLWGYENSTTLMKNDQPELLLQFPVAYKSATKSYYYGSGKYCDRLQLNAVGTIETEFDAFGMMILPNKDTLKNVLRIHTTKYIAEESKPLSSFGRNIHRPEENDRHPIPLITSDSIDYRLSSDSILFVVETFRWYERGYRYPVFETIQSWVQKQDQKILTSLTLLFSILHKSIII